MARKRNQPSSIERLPPDILEQLQALLRDPRITQLDATARINEILDAEGHPERVTKSSVGRYAARMAEVGERLRQSRAVAEMWIAKLGAQPQGQLGHLVNEMLRTLSFELTLKLQEGELNDETLPGVIDQLKQLSLSVVRLERAASENVKREAEIRKQALEEAARTVEAAARQQGATPATIDAMRAAILEGLSS